MVEAMDSESTSNNSPPSVSKETCVVCGDESDAMHFGQRTCRACAAFFRRTVSQNNRYICRFEGRCEIGKNQRNMCRACRFQKCLDKGMLIEAVHQRIKFLQDKQRQLDPHSDFPSSSTINSFDTTIPQSFPSTTPPLQETYPVTYNNPQISSFTPVQLPNMKILPQMVEGYHNFLSLRRAAYKIIDIPPRITNDDPDSIPLSNYGTSKKICRAEASLIMDIAVKYFHPFSLLDSSERIKIFDNFYCYFANSERAYQTYQRFGQIEGNERMIMPDGGYIKLSEHQKFYENSGVVNSNPAQLAQIFGNAMTYVVNTLVPHMVGMNLDEYEMVAIFGMFLWRDTIAGINPGILKIANTTTDDIIRDLHIYYKGRGLADMDVSVKLGKLFRLISKLETSCRLIRENYDIAALFNMFAPEGVCCYFTDCGD
ncbi:hypothetical protein FO519_001658 [Halicephalobus sp. NKZ332]|nr:hypothetical protein FO519_001658 [Halicephalobus sp. NKZ332]